MVCNYSFKIFSFKHGMNLKLRPRTALQSSTSVLILEGGKQRHEGHISLGKCLKNKDFVFSKKVNFPRLPSSESFAFLHVLCFTLHDFF